MLIFELTNHSATAMKPVIIKVRFSLFLIFHFSFCVFQFSLVSAQVPTVQDCLGARPVCQVLYFEQDSYLGEGNYPDEIYESLPCSQACPGSCLAGEINSIWYIWNVRESGMLRFTIDPVQAGDDYDWAVYDLTDLGCADIYTEYPLMQKSCNASGGYSNGITGISSEEGGDSDCNNCGITNRWNADLPVYEGRTYVLVIENLSSSSMGYWLEFSDSTAIISNDSPPVLDSVFISGIRCGVSEVTFSFSERVACEAVNPDDFLLTGPGGTYDILDVQGSVCMQGGEMDEEFT